MDLTFPFANCGTILSANSWANAALYCKTVKVTFNKSVFVVNTRIKNPNVLK